MYRYLINSFKLCYLDSSITQTTKLFSTFVVLLPIALITGPALPDILLSSVALYFLIISILKKLWRYYQNPVVLGFLLFCIYSIFRSIFSEFPFESLFNSGSIFYFRYIFFAMGVWYLADKNPYLINLVFIISVFCLSVVSIDGIYQYFMGYNILGYAKLNISRLTGLFNDEPKIGRYLAYLFMIIFALSFQVLKKNRISVSFLIVLISLSGLTIFLSGERVSVYVFAFFLLLTCFFKNRYQFALILSFFLSSILILIAISINPIAKDRIIIQTANQISQTKIGFLPYTPGYEKIYVASLILFRDHPVFGIGPAIYSLQCHKKLNELQSNCNSHPHNYFIQILSELGLVGFLFSFSLFLSLSFILIKQFIIQFKKHKSDQLSQNGIIFTVNIFVCFWPLIPHLDLYNNWQNVLIMLPLGFFMKNLFGERDNYINT